MKASRLIKILADHLSEHGDLEVKLVDYRNEPTVRAVSRCWAYIVDPESANFIAIGSDDK